MNVLRNTVTETQHKYQTAQTDVTKLRDQLLQLQQKVQVCLYVLKRGGGVVECITSALLQYICVLAV